MNVLKRQLPQLKRGGLRAFRGDYRIMGNTAITVTSLKDFFVKFCRMFSGATFFMTFRRIDPHFREKILLTVSMSNACGG